MTEQNCLKSEHNLQHSQPIYFCCMNEAQSFAYGPDENCSDTPTNFSFLFQNLVVRSTYLDDALSIINDFCEFTVNRKALPFCRCEHSGVFERVCKVGHSQYFDGLAKWLIDNPDVLASHQTKDVLENFVLESGSQISRICIPDLSNMLGTAWNVVYKCLLSKEPYDFLAVNPSKEGQKETSVGHAILRRDASSNKPVDTESETGSTENCSLIEILLSAAEERYAVETSSSSSSSSSVSSSNSVAVSSLCSSMSPYVSVSPRFSSESAALSSDLIEERGIILRRKRKRKNENLLIYVADGLFISPKGVYSTKTSSFRVQLNTNNGSGSKYSKNVDDLHNALWLYEIKILSSDKPNFVGSQMENGNYDSLLMIEACSSRDDYHQKLREKISELYMNRILKAADMDLAIACWNDCSLVKGTI